MSNLRIVYDDLVDRGTVTASSTAGALVASNLQTDTKSDVWRATGIAASIYAAWPAADTIQAVALPFCNLSPTATMRVRATNETSIINTLQYTENLENSGTWNQYYGIAAYPYAATAPDGTLTASALYPFAGNGNTGVSMYQKAINAATVGVVYTFSVFAKAGSTSTMRLGIGTSGAIFNAKVFNLSDAASSTGPTWQQTKLSNGWWRLSVQYAAVANSTLYCCIGFSTNLAAAPFASPYLYAWGTQFELGSAATSYYPSTDTFTSRAAGVSTCIDANGNIQTAASGAVRMSYNPYNLPAPPALLVEAAATNLVTSSGQFTTGWSGNVSVTATGVLYRGYESYKTLAKTLSSSSEQKSVGMAAVAAGGYLTLTIALRAGTTSTVSTGLYDSTSGGTGWGANADATCTFLEGPGAIGGQSGSLFAITGLSGTVDTLVQITRYYGTAATATMLAIYPGGSGSTTVGHSILATRVQVEAGRFPTSYIPTTTAVVTRSADLWNSVAGTRPTGYMDSWQVYLYDSGAQLACPAPALRPRGWSAAQAASAYAYGGGAYARMWLPAPMQATGVAVDIVDANNLQGYIEAARLVVGTYWSPTYNASEASVSVVDTTELYRTDAGDQGAAAGYQYRRVPVSLSAMPAADRAAFVNIVRNSRAAPILLSVFPDSADLALERDHMVYGRRSKDSDVAIQYAASYSTTIEIEEI